MTTVCWDGNVLAADARRTHNMDRVDGVVKIYLFPKGKVLCRKPKAKENKPDKKDGAAKDAAGESILAIAAAGSVSLIRTTIRSIQQLGWDFVIHHGTAWKSVTHGLADRHPGPGASLLAITERRVLTMSLTSQGVMDAEYGLRSEEVAIGSGRRVAEFMMKQFDLTAQEAVAAAALSDPGTGGYVQAVRFARTKCEQLPNVLLNDINATRRQIQTAIKRCKVPSEEKLFDQHVVVELP